MRQEKRKKLPYRWGKWKTLSWISSRGKRQKGYSTRDDLLDEWPWFYFTHELVFHAESEHTSSQFRPRISTLWQFAWITERPHWSWLYTVKVASSLVKLGKGALNNIECDFCSSSPDSGETWSVNNLHLHSDAFESCCTHCRVNMCKYVYICIHSAM